ncbi:MAG: Fic family protein [Lachnospirales bacterium]
MRDYDYTKTWEKLLTPDIVALITQINEFKGKQNLFINQEKDTLNHLLDIAIIQSTESSNKIEGIRTTNQRLKQLVQEKTNPQNRDEEEIAGYRDVLTTIHENYEFISIKPSFILQLHRDLYKYSGFDIGGKYKTSDNVISEKDVNGNEYVRFTPTEAWETSESIDNLCIAYNKIINDKKSNNLIISFMFILDFLCIHPFNDGNGRMSRLLTLLLLYRNDFNIGKYISIERIIEKTKVTYYETLEKSSYNWHDNTNDYEPFVKYMLGVIISAYREFEQRTHILNNKTKKPDRVAETIKNTLGKITKSEILELCPDISEATVRRALKDLIDNNDIIKLGGGRYTYYVWNGEKE